MAMGANIDSATAIRRVNDTLQGPVIEILCQLVPEVRKLPRSEAFDRTLDDIVLLERCFQTFRRERTRFKTLLVDERNRVVADDAVPLSCGRTLNEVVAMVVRTAAKRYFRRRHDPNEPGHKHIAPRLHQDVKAKGLVHRLASAFSEPEKKVSPAKCGRTRADELYDAIKEHLLHEWQVPMVPTYAEMTPTLVRSLGAKLLEVRDLDHLKRIADDPAEAAKLFDLTDDENAAAATPPAAPSAGMANRPVALQPVPATAGKTEDRARLSVVLNADGKSLRADAFQPVLLRPEVRARIPNGDRAQNSMEILRRVGGTPTKLLVAELGLRLDQLAVILLASHATVGPEVFGRIFGQPGNAELVMRITQRARLAGITQQSDLDACMAFVEDLFARFGPA